MRKKGNMEPFQIVTLKQCTDVTMLQDHDLVQIVDVPTYKGGHILDWVVMRSNVSCLSLTNVKEIDVLGDHKAIFSTISIKQPSEAKQLVMSRNMRAIDSISFLSDVEALVEGAKQCLESELVDINSNDICQILDCHASLTTRRVRDHLLASWLNDTVRTA